MTEAHADAESVPCPSCNAPEGSWCRNSRTGESRTHRAPCPARLVAAGALR